MKCKESDQIWGDGILHWNDNKVEHGRRQPHLDGWVRMMRKGLVSHLQIYDTGQQEASFPWLLLRDFGHHLTYPMTIGVLLFGTWHGTHIMW